MDTTDIITTATAAEILGVNQSRIRQLVIAGQLEKVEMHGSRDVFVTRQSVENYRANRRKAGRPKLAGNPPDVAESTK